VRGANPSMADRTDLGRAALERWGMKELIDYIARTLVEHPDQVDVREFGGDDRVRLELAVARQDMGRVIGKGGRVANAIRAILRVAAEREGKQATLDVVEPE
jgi:predicted RNA-binding protein YlqC (UPF0109 family)